jgi:hypothetical protein
MSYDESLHLNRNETAPNVDTNVIGHMATRPRDNRILVIYGLTRETLPGTLFVEMSRDTGSGSWLIGLPKAMVGYPRGVDTLNPRN